MCSETKLDHFRRFFAESITLPVANLSSERRPKAGENARLQRGPSTPRNGAANTSKQPHRSSIYIYDFSEVPELTWLQRAAFFLSQMTMTKSGKPDGNRGSRKTTTSHPTVILIGRFLKNQSSSRSSGPGRLGRKDGPANVPANSRSTILSLTKLFSALDTGSCRTADPGSRVSFDGRRWECTPVFGVWNGLHRIFTLSGARGLLLCGLLPVDYSGRTTF